MTSISKVITDPSASSPFSQAFEAWKAAESLRLTRDKLKKYTYGRQWEVFADRNAPESALNRYEHQCRLFSIAQCPRASILK